jgi:hypothetical protein
MEKAKISCRDCFEFTSDDISGRISNQVNDHITKTIQPLIIRVDKVEKQQLNMHFWLISLTVVIAFIIVVLFLILRTLYP